MFFLKKLLTALILPPGLIILFFCAIFLFSKRRNIIRFIAVFCGVFIYLLSIEPTSDFLISRLENQYRIPQRLEGDVIVILGGGVYNSGAFKEDTVNRAIAGYYVFKETNLPIILSGGSVEGKLSDSETLYKFFRELGISENKLIKETESRDTAENANFTVRICKERGYGSIILVTSAYHMKRALKHFSDKGVKVLPYPADSKISGSYNIYSFLPKSATLSLSVKALREHIALFTLHF